MLEKFIDLLRPEVKKFFKDDSSGHDINHLERTMKMALFLQSSEGGDELVIGVAAYLHDVHRILQNENGRYCSPKESLPIIEKLLNDVKFPEEKIPKVLHLIEYHEVYNWNKEEQVNDIETLILQDADNMDTIGAMGIARSFSYGGANNRPLFDPNVPLNYNDDYKEENGNKDASTIHHFYHKLFKLGDNMNTNTAKILAKEKIDFIKAFVDKFMDEWNSKF